MFIAEYKIYYTYIYVRIYCALAYNAMSTVGSRTRLNERWRLRRDENDDIIIYDRPTAYKASPFAGRLVVVNLYIIRAQELHKELTGLFTTLFAKTKYDFFFSIFFLCGRSTRLNGYSNFKQYTLVLCVIEWFGSKFAKTIKKIMFRASVRLWHRSTQKYFYVNVRVMKKKKNRRNTIENTIFNE